MAADTVEDLLFRLHLNADEMNQQFVQVSRTLNDNLSRINRERNLIDIQTRIDLQGLDRATDATQIFEVRQRSLQRQIELQRQRLNLLNVALQDTRQRTGDASDETQRAQIRYEQARLAVARLETQLQNLNETQNDTSAGTADWAERLQNVIKGGQFISAVKNISEVISAVNEQVMRLIERFKEMEKTAYDFNLPFDKAKEFAMQIRLAGGELEDVGGYLRGITDAIVKGEVDDPEWIALEKYGAEIIDRETGRLKSYAEIWDEVAKAYEKAKAAGNEIEFLQLTGGESGVTDAIQALERWKEAQEDAAKVVKSGIDAKELRQAERAVNLLTTQFEELHDALADLITPAVTEFAENLFKIFREGTKFVKENKDEIREWGATFAEISKHMPTTLPFTNAFDSLKNIFNSDSEAAENLKQGLDGLNKTATGKIFDRDNLSQYGVTRANQFRDEAEDIRLELDYIDEYQRKIAQLNLWKSRELDGKIYVSDDERAAIEELYSVKLEQIQRERAEKSAQILEESKQRTAQLVQETNEILAEKNLSPWEKEAEEIGRWQHQSLDAIAELSKAVKDKTALLEESAAVAQNAAAKETAAFEKEIERIEQELDRIRDKNMSLAEKIFEQEHSRRDIDVKNAQKERARMYEEGGYNANQIERWYKNRLAEIQKNVNEDRGGDYRKMPKLPDGSKQGNTDYWENIQKQAEKATNQTNAAQQLENQRNQLTQQHEQFQQALQNHADQFGQYIQDFAQVPEQTRQALLEPINNFSQSVQNFAQVPRQISSVVESLNKLPQEQPAQRTPPQITINLSPNINLGGAYVFDNAMKKRLTDDITTEVANAIKNAVQSAVNSNDYGYGT